MRKVIEVINDFCFLEYGYDGDFRDMSRIPLAYTTLTDYEIPVVVEYDAIKKRLNTYIGSDFPTEADLVDSTEVQPKDLEYHLYFDDLVAWSGYVEDHIEQYI